MKSMIIMDTKSIWEMARQIYESEFRLSESFRREEGRLLCDIDFIDGVLIIKKRNNGIDGYEIISQHTYLRTTITKELICDESGKRKALYLIYSEFEGSETQPDWKEEKSIQRAIESLRPIIRKIKLDQLGI